MTSVIQAETGQTIRIDPHNVDQDNKLQPLFLSNSTPSQRISNLNNIDDTVYRFQFDTDWKQVRDIIDKEFREVESVKTKPIDNQSVQVIRDAAKSTINDLQRLAQHVQHQHSAVNLLHRFIHSEIEKKQVECSNFKLRYAHRQQLLQSVLNDRDLPEAVQKLRETTLVTSRHDDAKGTLLHFVLDKIGSNCSASDTNATIVETLDNDLVQRFQKEMDISFNAVHGAEKTLERFVAELKQNDCQAPACETQQELVSTRFKSLIEAGDDLEAVRKADHELFESVQIVSQKLHRQNDNTAIVQEPLYQIAQACDIAKRAIKAAMIMQKRNDVYARKLGIVLKTHGVYVMLLDETIRRKTFVNNLRENIQKMDTSLKTVAAKENTARCTLESKIETILPSGEFHLLNELVPGILGNYVPNLKLDPPEFDRLLFEEGMKNDIADAREWTMLEEDGNDDNSNNHSETTATITETMNSHNQIRSEAGSNLLQQMQTAVQHGMASQDQHELAISGHISDAIAGVSALNKPTNMLTASATLMEKCKQEYEHLLAQFKQAQSDLEQKSTIIDGQEHEIQSIKSKMGTLISEHKHQLEIRDNSIEDLKDKLQRTELEKQDTCISLMERAQSSDQQHNETIKALKKRMDELRQVIAEKERAIEETKISYTNVAEQQSQLLLENHKREIETINSENSKEVQELKEAITRSNEKLEDETSKNNELVLQIQDLESQVQELTNSHYTKDDEILASRKMAGEYVTQIRDLESQKQKLESSVKATAEDCEKKIAVNAAKMLEMAEKHRKKVQEYEKQSGEQQTLLDKTVKDSRAQVEHTDQLRKQLQELLKQKENEQTEDRETLSTFITIGETLSSKYDDNNIKIQGLQMHMRDSIWDNAVSSRDITGVIQYIQQVAMLAISPLQEVSSLMQWDGLGLALVNFTNILDELHDNMVERMREEPRVAIDGVVEHNDRVVFLRTASSSHVWRVYTTNDDVEIYMHPDSIEVLKESLPNYKEHVAVSGSIVMVDKQEGNPLSLQISDYKLAMVEFDHLH